MVEEFLRGGQIGDNLKFVEEDNDGDCDCNCLGAFTGSPALVIGRGISYFSVAIWI